MFPEPKGSVKTILYEFTKLWYQFKNLINDAEYLAYAGILRHWACNCI